MNGLIIQWGFIEDAIGQPFTFPIVFKEIPYCNASSNAYYENQLKSRGTYNELTKQTVQFGVIGGNNESITGGNLWWYTVGY